MDCNQIVSDYVDLFPDGKTDVEQTLFRILSRSSLDYVFDDMKVQEQDAIAEAKVITSERSNKGDSDYWEAKTKQLRFYLDREQELRAIARSLTPTCAISAQAFVWRTWQKNRGKYREEWEFVDSLEYKNIYLQAKEWINPDDNPQCRPIFGHVQRCALKSFVDVCDRIIVSTNNRLHDCGLLRKFNRVYFVNHRNNKYRISEITHVYKDGDRYRVEG